MTTHLNGALANTARISKEVPLLHHALSPAVPAAWHSVVAEFVDLLVWRDAQVFLSFCPKGPQGSPL